MLNTSARQEAIGITVGEEPSNSVNEKVLMYGLLGRSFRLEDLDTLFFEQPKPDDFFELASQLSRSLKQIAAESYYSLSEDDQRTVEALFANKYPQANFDVMGRNYPYTPFPLERMLMGAVSAAEREIMTLRTVAKKNREGHGVSMEGLLASKRVPLQLALVHLFDLETEMRAQQLWSPNDGGDGGIVLPDEVISFTPETGLHLTTLPIHPDEVLKDKYGPQIGCPASFIKGYIQTIHEVSANLALENGFLKIG